MGQIPKYKIPVRLSLMGEGTLLGVIFVRQEQRVIDMLCDQRPFFPVSTSTGMLLVNKSSVVKIDVLEAEFILENLDSFPGLDAERDFQAHAAFTERRMRNEMETAKFHVAPHTHSNGDNLTVISTSAPATGLVKPTGR